MSRIDLDQAAKARKDTGNAEAPVVVFRGEEFTLPRTIPYGVYMKLVDMTELDAEKDSVAAGRIVGEIVKEFFGSDWARFEALGPGLDDVMELFRAVFPAYNVAVGESAASQGSSSGTGTTPKSRSKRATGSTSGKKSSDSES